MHVLRPSCPSQLWFTSTKTSTGYRMMGGHAPPVSGVIYGTPVQLLHAQTEAVVYKPTLARPSARNSRYGIVSGRSCGCVSHRQELSTSPSYLCCCEPEFDPALLLIESRHDALDSPSTPCIRVPSPLAWGRNNVRELRAKRRYVLGDGGLGSILTATPFS